ncbi:dolichyl-phosphate beta-D-mannosyltransferase [Flavipsychrobacter stenotrophus]|uniref:Dolichyl-phosphate beta-D-mannosyltransferase n=1 Tax=Flavipsychrobacter stenotrophus TaxID=2077091 RepID=A0A2S7SZT8_9BACT|nr:polyprenol monophosphomannose synthase [Flavipsychrobacter stenotrophus]PQJ12208.1 dolichyl-phosphate beta-D-mannosyltransferase [Flavipsychrobacter stenotrophus]
MKKLVIIPTYNEKENIEKIIRRVFSLSGGYHLLIVDDGSPDGTADIIKGLQTEYGGRLNILERKGKLGLGTAYIAGFKWALRNDYDYIFEMDADFSHKPEDLERLYEACTHGADVVVGSRYVRGGKVVNWPMDRIMISKGGAFYTKLITWMPVSDPTAGFVCYSRKVLATIPLDEVHFIGYAFQIEMKYRAWKLGFKIKEVPITFEDRKEGVSKMSGNIIKEAMYGVWKMRGFSNK